MVLGIPTKTLRDIARSISKGNFKSLLDIMSFDYYEDSIIYASLISKIKEFDLTSKYLDKYSDLCECWASCDALKFNIRAHERDYLGIIDKYVKSYKPFVRRIGMSILFEFLRDHKYIDKIFYYLDEFYLEDNYYVNMMNAWLLCECFINEYNNNGVLSVEAYYFQYEDELFPLGISNEEALADFDFADYFASVYINYSNNYIVENGVINFGDYSVSLSNINLEKFINCFNGGKLAENKEL